MTLAATTLKMYYEGEYHKMSCLADVSTFNNTDRASTTIRLEKGRDDNSFLDTVSGIKTALYNASVGEDTVYYVRADGSDADRHFGVYGGDVVQVYNYGLWIYVITIEHTLYSEAINSPIEASPNINILNNGASTAVSALIGDRPARISEAVFRSGVAGVRIKQIWAGFLPGVESFDPTIDFPGTFTNTGNAKSGDTQLQTSLNMVEVVFTQTEDMIHRFESKFAMNAEVAGDTTAWNSSTAANASDYVGKHRLIITWSTDSPTSAFLTKIYAGFEDGEAYIGSKRLSSAQVNETHSFEIGVIELPANTNLNNYSIRVEAARLSGDGYLRIGKGKIIPYTYSIAIGNELSAMAVRKGPPETKLHVITDNLGNVTAYAKGDYDTYAPVISAENWRNPGGVLVVHAETLDTYEIDDNDSLTVEMSTVPTYGLHTPFIEAVTPTVVPPITDRT